MGRVFSDAGEIVLEHGGHRIWSSDGRPVNLLPSSDWLTPSLSVSYPDLVKRNAYVYLMTPYSCMSLATVLPGEWFPGASGVYDLPQDILGTVPADVNYLDVRVSLVRTKDPTDYLFNYTHSLLPPYQTLAPGGSCLCEYNGLWSRAFEIVLDGSNVVLRRRQSVIATAPTLPWNSGNNNDAGVGGRRPGWTHGGGAGSDTAYPAAVMEIIAAGENPSVNKRRGESDACSLVDTTDFSSIFTGSAVIRPGYIAP